MLDNTKPKCRVYFDDIDSRKIIKDERGNIISDNENYQCFAYFSGSQFVGINIGTKADI